MGSEDLRDAGVEEIGVVLGNRGWEAIQEFLGDGSRFGVNVTHIVQGRPLGLAHAVACASDFVGDDDFVVYLGDNILHRGIDDLVESFQAGDHAAGIALQHVDDPRQFGIADIDEDGEVRELIEKPDDPPSEAIPGRGRVNDPFRRSAGRADGGGCGVAEAEPVTITA